MMRQVSDPSLATLLAKRSACRHYDEELWAFHENAFGRNLENVTDAELLARLGAIEKCIHFLDADPTPRDDLTPERGWISPWWWYRARYWTLLEIGRRELRGDQIAEPSGYADAFREIDDHFTGNLNGGPRILTRISKRGWLNDTLSHGILRFAPAASYKDELIGEARTDDEMAQEYRRPGKQLTIMGPNGLIEPIGDVTFSSSRAIAGQGRYPYWLSCFSDSVDVRLFDEFASNEPESDVCLVIFDPNRLAKQALPALNRFAPRAHKDIFPVDYYDPYYGPFNDIKPKKSKRLEYAYQKETRFVIDPVDAGSLPSEQSIFINIGSISEFAGIYSRSGEKISGTGPSTFIRDH